MKGVSSKHANGTRQSSVGERLLQSALIDACKSQIWGYLQCQHIASMKAPFPGNLRPLWPVRITRHTQKKQTNQRGGWRHETKQLGSPSARISPTANESREQRELKKRKGHERLAQQRWRQVTYGGPATLRTGTIQDPNWKVKKVQGFVPESSARTEAMHGYISTAFTRLLVLRQMALGYSLCDMAFLNRSLIRMDDVTVSC